MHKTYFFDSHGGLWVTCDPHDDGGVAFGPSGIAREADPDEVGLVCKGQTPWRAAFDAGRLDVGVEAHEWDILLM